ncbi:AbrB/MazE/SpoVT family DNA-binding domain-containing protein [Calderihabitans maritimus]|uniref:AbrB family transcriptional regulator n=1 Tax=Calderihabitans maritimus TaxID=1246530 RepID=A0A1Z5HTA9_9FIRM|nr:AbrB/MazE/SpoVT family DNA-binding domain-containing protein [Calderihabitans maritimus]GAW92773.1 AbrB family transcriptional regulator [Calderihabitans maritimus]
MINKTKVFTPKVGSKGLMTLPKQVRDVLGIKEGDRILLKIEPDGRVVLEKALIVPANECILQTVER